MNAFSLIRDGAAECAALAGLKLAQHVDFASARVTFTGTGESLGGVVFFDSIRFGGPSGTSTLAVTFETVGAELLFSSAPVVVRRSLELLRQWEAIQVRNGAGSGGANFLSTFQREAVELWKGIDQ